MGLSVANQICLCYIMLWQIDSISYLGTTGKANIRSVNPISGSASSSGFSAIELMEFPTPGVDQNLQPDQASDPIDEEKDKTCDEQNNSDRNSPQQFAQNEVDFLCRNLVFTSFL